MTEKMKRAVALLSFFSFCKAQQVIVASFANDNPAITENTLRFTTGGNVLTDYPSLSLAPGQKIIIDQSDASNAGLTLVLNDQTSFAIDYFCPAKCTLADYVATNAFRFTTTGGKVPIPGFSQLITAPNVATSSSYHIAGYVYNGAAVTVTVDQSSKIQLYVVAIILPVLFVVSNELSLRLFIVDGQKTSV